MLKNIAIITISAVVSTAAAILLLPMFAPGGSSQIPSKNNDDMIRQRFKQQQEMVLNMVIADTEKYGPDIYRLYCEISRSNSMIPDADFGVDKSYKKLSVTYPHSNIYKLAEAWNFRKALRDRDMIQIERAISESPADGSTRLLPNGFELEPLLYMAVFNYQQHTGRLNEATETLTILEKKYGDCPVFEEQRIMAVKEWVASQKRIHNAILKAQKANKL